ncbi:VOC family protein [Acuticoccus sp. MNP-M23]|uniref:VOC family protein n=1 Tax=Acuticoccus sp. MNP-M23 TaxID=3072793 RepID=UPI002814E17A|nr:VOC family protein [Acuticoccus sp. MNP-M23]WMS42877.1 VOC family protein [Acuticoccus sp. MNP-M23]
MAKLDHLIVIAPSLGEGVTHVRKCLDIDVPFESHQADMATHNLRLQLGSSAYLEIVALDPKAAPPGRRRWFGLDNEDNVRADWNKGRRLRSWVARSNRIASALAAHGSVLGAEVRLPAKAPTFAITIPDDGSLPLDGAAPTLVDYRGDPPSMTHIPDLRARLRSFTLEHPDPDTIAALYRDLLIENPPKIIKAEEVRYRALIETPAGLKELT